jgi:hypothetical protein
MRLAKCWFLFCFLALFFAQACECGPATVSIPEFYKSCKTNDDCTAYEQSTCQKFVKNANTDKETTYNVCIVNCGAANNPSGKTTCPGDYPNAAQACISQASANGTVGICTSICKTTDDCKKYGDVSANIVCELGICVPDGELK